MFKKGPQTRANNPKIKPPATTTTKKAAPDFTAEQQKEMARKIILLNAITDRNGQSFLSSSNPLLALQELAKDETGNIESAFDIDVTNPCSPTKPSTSTFPNSHTTITDPPPTLPPSPSTSTTHTPLPKAPRPLEAQISGEEKNENHISSLKVGFSQSPLALSRALFTGKFSSAQGEGGGEGMEDVVDEKTFSSDNRTSGAAVHVGKNNAISHLTPLTSPLRPPSSSPALPTSSLSSSLSPPASPLFPLFRPSLSSSLRLRPLGVVVRVSE